MIWGLLMAWTKLMFVGPHFPFLTILTLVATILGVSKYKKSDLFFVASACLWIVASGETFGFVMFFGEGKYIKLLFGVIPLLLSFGLLMSVQSEHKFIDSIAKKILIVPLYILLGIGSYMHKPTIVEVNCWYYLDSGKTYNVVFAKTPERTFEVELSSDELKNQVIEEAIQYEYRDGYYCPETKVRVTTRFGAITSAKIISFRNTEKDKKVEFSRPTNIPLNEVKGKLEILKPTILSVWN